MEKKMPPLQKLMLSLILCWGLLAGNCIFGENTAPQAQVPKEPGLVAYYNFDEGEGNAVRDISGNGNNGKISGKPKWLKVTDDFEVQLFGNALEMSTVVNCGHSAGLDIKGNALTVEAWFKTGATNGYYPISQKFTTDWKTKFRGYCLNIEKGNTIRLWLGFENTGKAFDTEKILVPHTFYHVIATYDGCFVKIYLNGKMITTIPESRSIASNIDNNLYIGEEGAKSDNLIDGLKIYSRALNAVEVKAAFDADKKQNRYKVTDTSLKESSPNLLLNSSFRRCSNPGIPDWWGTGMAAVIKDWNNQMYGIDESMSPPVPGVKCLRLTAMKSGFWLNSTFPCFPGGKDYIFSVYLKAENAGTVAAVSAITGKHFKLTTEWQRYEVTGFLKASSMRDLSITAIGNGPVWIAAPQMEYGTKSTPYQAADADNINRTTEAATLKSTVCPQTDTAPQIDGILDDACWKNAAVLDDFRLLGGNAEPASTSTSAKIACDKKNLYIAFCCNEPDMNNLKAKAQGRDVSGVFNDDSVEIFLSTNPDAAGYYQIAANSQGSAFDAFSSNAGWNADLRCAAKKNQNDWIVEFEIPLAALNHSSPESPWRINLCRSRYAGKAAEYSSWSPINGNSFHTPERMGWFAGIEIPANMTTANKKPDVPALQITTEYDYYTRDESAMLFVDWTPDYPAELELVLKEKNSGRTFKPLAKAIHANGTSTIRIKVPLAGLANGEYEVCLNASAAGHATACAKDTFRKLPPASNEVRVYKPGRYLVENGNPVLLYGPTVSLSQWRRAGKDLWQLDDIKAHGFNSMWVPFETMRSMKDLNTQEASIRAFLDECHSKGLRILFYMEISNVDYPVRKELAEEIVRRFKDHPAITVWNFVDEPDLWWSKKNKESDLLDLYSAIKVIDPYRPAFINWCFWKKSPYGSLDASDIASVDRYPLRYSALNFNPEIISGLAESINNDGRAVKKPVNFFIQMQGFWDMSREPTPTEIKWMTYVNFICGTRIFQYFSYKPMSDELWEAMIPLGADLMKLFKIVTDPGAKETASGRYGGTCYSLWEVSGQRIMIVANEKNKPVQVSLDVGALSESKGQAPNAGSISSHIELEKIEIKNNILKLSLKPLQCGIYELKGNAE